MTKEKIKKIAKYVTNILAMINALLVGLAPIWNWNWTGKVSDTIIVITGVIGAYLVSGKLFNKGE